MISVKTKFYQLPTSTFIKTGMASALKQYWWAFLVPVALIIPGFFFPKTLIWLVPSVLVLTLLYVAFWYVQFYGITQLPQGKPFFERYQYEFRNDMLLLRKNQKEGMPIKWDMIQRAERREDALLLWLSRGQFFYLPTDIFTSQNDLKWAEMLLKRKKLLGSEIES